MFVIQSYFKMNIKSHVVPGKNMVEDAQKKISSFAKTNLDFN